MSFIYNLPEATDLKSAGETVLRQDGLDNRISLQLAETLAWAKRQGYTYLGEHLVGISFTNTESFTVYQGKTYFVKEGTSLPYVSTNVDATLEVGLDALTEVSQVTSIVSNANLLSNHNFLTQTPDDSQPRPDATPRSYPPGYQIFSGVFANESTGITNLTYIDGRVSFSGGDLYFSVSNTGAIARLTSDQLTASVADFDGKPRTRGVSFALVGDEYRVTVGVDALDDGSGNATPLGSVKFEQGGAATGHSTHEPLTDQTAGDVTSYQAASVSDMVSGKTFGQNKITLALGQYWSTGGSKWRLEDDSSPITEDNFRVFNAINVLDFGAVGNDTDDDSDPIIAAISYAMSVGTNSGLGTIESSPPNTQTGQYPDIYFPPRVYLVTKELPYNKYHNFFGYGAIIHQSNPSSDIFTTETCYINGFYGIKFVGGACQIQAKNTSGIGLEGCVIKIHDCDFTSTHDYAVKLISGPTAGGEQATIRDCKFTNFKQAVLSTFDIFALDYNWISTRASYQDNDTAWLNVGRVNAKGNMFVPVDGYNVAGNTNRYFDVSKSIVATGNRFGAEGPSGLPIVYCFNDARNASYPYQGGDSCVIRDNHMLYSGGPNRDDYGVIVLKSGIFKTVVIEGNSGSADGPYIRTNLMATSFADYMTSLASNSNQNRLSISIQNNSKWAASIADTQGSADLLAPFMTYDVPWNGRTVKHIGRLSATYEPSSGVGTSPISNTMSEYEYGNFSLTYISNAGFTGATGFANQECKYVKVGKNVNISCGVSLDSTAIAISEGNYVLFSGMPFVPEDLQNGNQQHVGQVIFYESIGGVNMGTGICIYNVGNDQTYLYVTNVLGTVSGDCQISFTVSYVED